MSAFDEVIDSVSLSLGVPNACGPIGTQLLARNQKDEETTVLPNPFKYNAVKRAITVESGLDADAGSYTITLAIFLENDNQVKDKRTIEVKIAPKVIEKPAPPPVVAVVVANTTVEEPKEPEPAPPVIEVQPKVDVKTQITSALP